MKTFILIFTLFAISGTNSYSFNSKDSSNIVGLWFARVHGDEPEYRFLQKKIENGNVTYDTPNIKKGFQYLLLIDSSMSGALLIKFDDYDYSILCDINFDLIDNDKSKIYFSRGDISIAALDENLMTLHTNLTYDSLRSMDCFMTATKIDNYERGAEIFKSSINSQTYYESFKKNNDNLGVMFDVQSRNIDVYNFRLSLDFVSRRYFYSSPVFTAMPMTFSKEKLSDGNSIYSTNYFLWGSFMAGIIAESAFKNDVFKSPDWLLVSLLVINIPNMLLNWQLDFPLYSRKSYLGATIGINTDWYFFANDNSGDFCFEPKIGLRYLYNKSVGFELSGNYPLWTNGENVMKKMPYLGLNLNIMM